MIPNTARITMRMRSNIDFPKAFACDTTTPLPFFRPESGLAFQGFLNLDYRQGGIET
jgi:hypothetical protein